MAVIEKGSQEFQPYARLLNIIGDQLITDKKVAVIEIIKNSYDADAGSVQVRFFNMENFHLNYLKEHERPYIEIEDDGDGMSLETIKNVWLRPATPSKLDKKSKKQHFTKKGRIIQGEKGVGRFAIHKLGEKIELFTKAYHQKEIRLSLDFTEFNPEKADLFNQPTKEFKLLNQVLNHWTVNDPSERIKKSKGTIIRISNLREFWTEKDLRDLYKSIGKLIPPYDPNAGKLKVDIESDFEVELFVDGELYTAESVAKFEDVIERAPFALNGTIEPNGKFTFSYSSAITGRKISKQTVNLLDEVDLAKYDYDLYSFRIWFSKLNREPRCGRIQLSLYAYDLSNRDKTIITNDMLEFIKDNFIYVFRDGVRVYPFGEKEYDWLELDKLRAVVKAGFFPSYNDLIGFIYISQEKNPLLKDSTNRQGMMNIDGAYDDFRYLVLSATEILNAESKIDKEKRKIEKNKPIQQSNAVVSNAFGAFRRSLERVNDGELLKQANKFFETVQQQSDLMKDRMETVEDLAGLGMAVEKASHDSLMLLSKVRGNLKDFLKKAKRLKENNEEIISFLHSLDESLEIILEELQIIQPLFKIQRKAVQDISVHEFIEKVIKYFRRDIEGKIDVRVIGDRNLILKTNPGLILQVLINIIDNAIYWVRKGDNKKKEIVFKISSSNNTLIIADNGPGIRVDAIPMIFNEFFSLKSNGRGLGLYIVKEILLRINADISVIQDERRKISTGANFIIQFNQD